MIFSVDPANPTPMYAQIAEQVKHGIASGFLRRGEALPSVRELAVKLEINPLTVLRAYRDLEAEGIVTVRHGLGCFVAAEPEQAVESYRMEIITSVIDRLVDHARNFGVSLEQLEAMLRQRMSRATPGERERVENADAECGSRH